MENLEEMIRKEFGKNAEEIIAYINCGYSVDAAIQIVICK